VRGRCIEVHFGRIGEGRTPYPSRWQMAMVEPSRDCLETPNRLHYGIPRGCGTGRKGTSPALRATKIRAVRPVQRLSGQSLEGSISEVRYWLPSLIRVPSMRSFRHVPSSKARRISPARGVYDVGHRPRAEDEVGAGLPRTVHDLVGVRHARRPACRVAGVEGMRAIFLDHGRLPGKHVEQLVLLFVPVPVGRARARLQRLDVGNELGQPTLLGEVHRRSLRLRAPYVCSSSAVPRSTDAWSFRMIISALLRHAVAAGEPNFAPREAPVQGEQVTREIRPCIIHFTGRSACSCGWLLDGSSRFP
jgi:hypothetical protein